MGYKLLSVNSNPKIDKSNKVSEKYWSCIMHLRPINTKICPYQDIAKCKEACLNTAGLGGVYPSIQKARQKKTELFLNDRDQFMQVLIKDIHTFLRACKRKDKLPAIRLNGTSDIQWEKIDIEGQNIFEMFPNVQFYDYTKIPTRKVDNIPNYHLTWSYSEANEKYAKMFDKVPNNKAVVFKNKILPTMFKGLKVIDGDTHDMRFLDKPNSVVGLKAKGKARQDKSGFVINVIQLA
tara:strand:+ start:1007 stop:1714 length:708 start_codon:yes stop_codon:yes gene_type:complete